MDFPGGRVQNYFMVNHLIRFSLDLTYDQYMAYYQGVAQSIAVISDDGRHIQFPARNIRRFLTNTGIQGYFEMEVTAQNRFVEIRKLD